MVQIYCRNKHGTKGSELCPECRVFRVYAKIRLDKCPFQEKKSTCGKCLIHCYQPVMREKVKVCYALFRSTHALHSPGLAMLHAADGFRKPPKKQLREPNFLLI
jgi:hypothetical protein